MVKRTTQGLRDILFDEIEELRSGKGEPAKAMAIANLAKQIINTAKVEMDFVRTIAASEANGTTVGLGNLQLGTTKTNHAPPAEPRATANSRSTKEAPHASAAS